MLAIDGAICQKNKKSGYIKIEGIKISLIYASTIRPKARGAGKICAVVN